MLDRQDIERKVKEVLADKLDISIEKINPASSLKEDLGMDSFAAIEVGFELEDSFGIDIPNEDISSVEIVRDIVRYISLKLADKA